MSRVQESHASLKNFIHPTMQDRKSHPNFRSGGIHERFRQTTTGIGGQDKRRIFIPTPTRELIPYRQQLFRLHEAAGGQSIEVCSIRQTINQCSDCLPQHTVLWVEIAES